MAKRSILRQTVLINEHTVVVIIIADECKYEQSTHLFIGSLDSFSTFDGFSWFSCAPLTLSAHSFGCLVVRSPRSSRLLSILLFYSSRSSVQVTEIIFKAHTIYIIASMQTAV